MLREYLPLEQGLRQIFIVFWNFRENLREYLPLEQGLRQLMKSYITMLNVTQRVSSIRTRIKTVPQSVEILILPLSESIFH